MAGKREERMCDKLIRLGPNTDLAARVPRAEKFTFDAATTTRPQVTKSSNKQRTYPHSASSSRVPGSLSYGSRYSGGWGISRILPSAKRHL
jgi:hypothetical protein